MLNMNINKTMADMARMSPDQLKASARMHVNDPYMMALFSGENARRQALKPQPQEHQQPTVVNQEIAQMGSPPPVPMMPQGQAQAMPEDTGIAQIPANNLKNMAEGGIVAFAPGGEVEGQALDAAKAKEAAIQNSLRGLGLMYRQKNPEAYQGALTAQSQAQQERQDAEAAYAAAMESSGVNRALMTQPTAGTTLNYGTPAVAPAPAPAATSVKTPLAPPEVAPEKTTTDTTGGLASLQAAAAAAGSQSREPRVAGTVVGRPAAPAKPYLEQYAETRRMQGPSVDPEAEARNKLVADRNTASQATKTELETDIASRKDQFAKREERQDTRAAALEKSKDTNTGMAFLQAGLAMMQAKGPGLAAIAQGAGVGVNQYSAGLKDLKAAQEKLDEARDKTDELKQNQSMMDKKELRTAKKDIRDTELQGQEYLIAGRSKTHGEELAVAAAATKSDIEARQKTEENASKERIAALTHAIGLRPSETERITATYLKLKATNPAGAEEYIKGVGLAKGAGKSMDAMIADKANDNVDKQIQLGGIQLQTKINRDPSIRDEMLRKATAQLMGTMPKPGAETAPPGPEIHYDAKGNRVK